MSSDNSPSRQESLGVNRAGQVGDPGTAPSPESSLGCEMSPCSVLRGRGHVPQAQARLGSRAGCSAPAQGQEEAPSSQGAFWSLGISGDKTNEKGELRLSPAEENLRAEPSGEHPAFEQPSLSRSWSSGLGCTSNPSSRPKTQLSPLGSSGC